MSAARLYTADEEPDGGGVSASDRETGKGPWRSAEGTERQCRAPSGRGPCQDRGTRGGPWAEQAARGSERVQQSEPGGHVLDWPLPPPFPQGSGPTAPPAQPPDPWALEQRQDSPYETPHPTLRWASRSSCGPAASGSLPTVAVPLLTGPDPSLLQLRPGERVVSLSHARSQQGRSLGWSPAWRPAALCPGSVLAWVSASPSVLPPQAQKHGGASLEQAWDRRIDFPIAVPLRPSCCGFFFVLDMQYRYF